MNYQINAAVFSHSGAVRPNNEDNYCFHGEVLPMSHTAPAYSHAFLPLNDLLCFAVFDGMGGEQSGEAASYQAARTLSQQLSELNTGTLSQDVLHSLFLQMNRAICDYAKAHKLSSVGTTAAALFCTPSRFICANMGDSRIYRFHDRELVRLSCDHVSSNSFYCKPPLTQYLGHPPALTFSPHFADEPIRNGAKYLICTDGVTDMVSEFQLANILSQPKLPRELLNDILSEVHRNGAEDNATAILLEVRKSKRIPFLRR